MNLVLISLYECDCQNICHSTPYLWLFKLPGHSVTRSILASAFPTSLVICSFWPSLSHLQFSLLEGLLLTVSLTVLLRLVWFAVDPYNRPVFHCCILGTYFFFVNYYLLSSNLFTPLIYQKGIVFDSSPKSTRCLATHIIRLGYNIQPQDESSKHGSLSGEKCQFSLCLLWVGTMKMPKPGLQRNLTFVLLVLGVHSFPRWLWTS